MSTRGGLTTKKTVEAGKTLLVDGPASVTLVAGKADIFGYQLDEPRIIIIREGKRLPFTVFATATFEIALGRGANETQIEGSSIPKTWEDAYLHLIEIQKKPLTVMVLGGVDLGKSSFCTYLANRLITKKSRVAILDEDLGQSDIGPPSTVAYAFVAKQFTDMFNLKPEKTYFVGVTSPSETPEKTVQAASHLKEEINSKTDYLIVNTDGWISGEEAIKFKKILADSLEPDIVFSLQRKNEQPFFLEVFKEISNKTRMLQIEAAARVRERSREKRKSLRELGFAKNLDNSKLRIYPLTEVIIEEDGKTKLAFPKQSENLLVGLHNLQREFLGIGVIRAIDYVKCLVKIQTVVEEKTVLIVLGKVRLDNYLSEIPDETTA